MNKEMLQTVVGIIWALVMLVATFALDEPSNVVPFWLLLIAYYIVIWRKSGNPS